MAAQLQAGPLGAARTAGIVARVSAALHAVHRAALAHGDIRPEKILLRRDGAAKLFGFSGTCPAESAAIGADLRALGVLARECLGEPTSPGEPSASVTDLVAELCAHPSAGHADVTAAIARRAAALRAQLGKAGGDAALSASQSASSTPPAWFLRTASSSLSGRPGDRPPELRQTSVTHGPCTGTSGGPRRPLSSQRRHLVVRHQGAPRLVHRAAPRRLPVRRAAHHRRAPRLRPAARHHRAPRCRRQPRWLASGGNRLAGEYCPARWAVAKHTEKSG